MSTDRLRRHFILSLAASALAGLCLGTAQASAQGSTPTILVLGDSLSAEYGLARGTGWVALLEERLAKEKIHATVVNASISGDTTSGGRARLPALLNKHKPAVVVIELGGNDALRGLPMKNTQDNLSSMAQSAQKTGAKVLLVGMQVPPNYGSDYARRFAAAFGEVARQHQTALVPFLLEGVANGPDAASLFQPDRIHPNAQAHPRMLENVWPALRKLLR